MVFKSFILAALPFLALTGANPIVKARDDSATKYAVLQARVDTYLEVAPGSDNPTEYTVNVQVKVAGKKTPEKVWCSAAFTSDDEGYELDCGDTDFKGKVELEDATIIFGKEGYELAEFGLVLSGGEGRNGWVVAQSTTSVNGVVTDKGVYTISTRTIVESDSELSLEVTEESEDDD